MAEIQPVACVNHSRFILPLAGRVAVYDGHDVLSHHRRSGYIGAAVSGGNNSFDIDRHIQLGDMDRVVSGVAQRGGDATSQVLVDQQSHPTSGSSRSWTASAANSSAA